MNILLTGNTHYITEEFIVNAFPNSKVTILGPTLLKSSHKQRLTVLPFSDLEEDIEQVFRTYEFTQVVFFSNFLTFHNMEVGEAEYLQKILAYSDEYAIARFLYLSGPEASFAIETQESMMAKNYEQLCLYYNAEQGLNVKVIRAPYLYSDTYIPPYLHTLFQKFANGKAIQFKESHRSVLHFLSIDDLAHLLYKVTDSWATDAEVLTVPDTFNLTLEDLVSSMYTLNPEAAITFANVVPKKLSKKQNPILRQQYGWFAKYSPLEGLIALLQTRYIETSRKTGFGSIQQALQWFRRQEKVWRLLEVALIFILSEFLTRLVATQLQFRMIDVRLLFVVLISSALGIGYGFIAAGLASVALLITYMQQGSNWITVFYDPINWVPFVIYIVTSAICGRMWAERRNEQKVLKRDNQILREKAMFIRQLYQDVLQEKQSLKRQVLGSRDSYGRVYTIVRRLSSQNQEVVLREALNILEEILHNVTVGFYLIDSDQIHASLVLASHNNMAKIPEQLQLSNYRDAMEQIHLGELWVNRQLHAEFPIYMAGIKQQQHLKMLIWIQDVQYDHINLHYYNLLKIVCGLIETSVAHTLD